MKILLFILLTLLTGSLSSASDARIEIHSPAPLLLQGTRLTYQAIDGESVRFIASFRDKIPLPTIEYRIARLRLMYAEEEPVRTGRIDCVGNPCYLNYTIEINEFAHSKFTMRGVDESGATVVNTSFYIDVGDRAEDLEWKCHPFCTDEQDGSLIINAVARGYPDPHLYQVLDSQGRLVKKNEGDSETVFNLTRSEIGGERMLTLVATNRLGQNISMNITVPTTKTSSTAATLPSPATYASVVQHEPATAEADQTLVIIVPTAVIGTLVFAAVCISIICFCHKRRKLCHTHRTNPSPVVIRDGDVEAAAAERISLTDPPEEQNIELNCLNAQTGSVPVHQPSAPVPVHNTVLPPHLVLNFNTQIVKSGSDTESSHFESNDPSDDESGITCRHAPPTISHEQENSISIKSDDSSSLDQDGPEPETHEMEDLKDSHDSDTSENSTNENIREISDDLETDGFFPVQESQGPISCLREDSFSSH